MKNIRTKWAFTLIELLIVVAIIAILAAIAVPNFLEAQVRAKVSRTKNDLRTMAVALEAYAVDYNTYTRDSDSSLDYLDVGPTSGDMGHEDYARCANGGYQLTTPISYITTLLDDPFANAVEVEGAGARGYRIASGSWSYDHNDLINTDDDQDSHLVFAIVGKRHCFAVIGVGPDGSRARMAYKNFPYMSMYESDEGAVSTAVATDHPPQPCCWTDYDPTNGTTSVGDIYRFGGDWRNGRFMLNGATIGQQDPLSSSQYPDPPYALSTIW